MVNEQKLYVNQSKKQIEDLNVLLMNKYEKKKELDVKILSIMNKKINSFEKFCKQNSNTNTNSITNLKNNIKKLQDTMIITDDENL
jgi:polyhydroxyalkanoate synthesis regulator phasin